MGESKKCFFKFIEDFLSKQNSNYSKYKELLWEDFRNGGSHSILPKGAVVLTGGEAEKEHHLEIMKDPTRSKYHLILSTPIFIEDMRVAILKFVEKAQTDSSLVDSYVKTIEKHNKDSQNFIKTFMAKNKISVDFEDKLEGDIHIKLIEK
jgi:hypothetical protein